jgi:hypothetical protein
MSDVVQLRHQTRVSLSDHFPHVDYGSFRGRVLGTFIDRIWASWLND